MEKPTENYLLLLIKVFNYWPIIILSILISMAVAYYTIASTIPVYQVSTTILINDDKNATSSIDIGIGSSAHQPYKIKKEMGILCSYELIQSAVEQLNFEVAYYQEGPFYRKLLYPDSPFTIEWHSASPQLTNVPFKLKCINDSMLHVSASCETGAVYSFASKQMIQSIDNIQLDTLVKPNQRIVGPGYDFIIRLPKTVMNESPKNLNYQFEFNAYTSLVSQFRQFNIREEEGASILRLTLSTENSTLGIHFLNALSEAYLNKDIEQKNTTAIQTIRFIDTQIIELQDTLFQTEKAIQALIRSTGGLDLDYKSEYISDNLTALEGQMDELQMQLKYYHYLTQFVHENQSFEKITFPTSLKINNAYLDELLTEINHNIFEHEQLSRRTIQETPMHRSNRLKLEELKTTLLEVVAVAKRNLIHEQSTLLEKIASLKKELDYLSDDQRQFIALQRKQTINENLYTVLLAKRSEI